MVRQRRCLVIATALALASPAWADSPKKAAGPSDDVAYLPMDSEIVGGLDFAQIQQSALWKKFIEPLLTSGDAQKKLATFKTMCGIDPLAAVSKVSFGMKNAGSGNPPEGVLVAHGVSKTKLTACFAKQQPLDDVEVKLDGPVAIIKSKSPDGQNLAVTFLNETTAIAVLGSNATKAGALAAVKGGNTLKSSPAFMDMFAKTRTQDTVWLLINSSSAAFAKVGSAMGTKPKAMFGSINVGKDVTADFRMRLGSAADAKTLATSMQGQAQQAAGLFDKINVGSDGSDVTIAIAISSVKLDALLKMLGSGGP